MLFNVENVFFFCLLGLVESDMNVYFSQPDEDRSLISDLRISLLSMGVWFVR